jgi:hypothetical protein
MALRCLHRACVTELSNGTTFDHKIHPFLLAKNFHNTIQYNKNLYRALCRKRIRGALMALDRYTVYANAKSSKAVCS